MASRIAAAARDRTCSTKRTKLLPAYCDQLHCQLFRQIAVRDEGGLGELRCGVGGSDRLTFDDVVEKRPDFRADLRGKRPENVGENFKRFRAQYG